MLKLCLSYRREDSAAIAGRIRDRLVAHYGADAVFMDIDDIPIGVDFKKHIDGVLRQSDILLAVVGPKWLGTEVTGLARIHRKGDPVRVEVQTALQAPIPVIPVLVDGAKMPGETDVPKSLKEFAVRNAAEVESGRDFSVHMDRLIRSIDRILAEQGKGPISANTVSDWRTSSSNLPAGDVASQSSESQANSWLPYLSKYLVAPLILMMLAHYLIIMKFDLNAFYLRVAAVIIPLSVGFLLYWHGRQGAGSALILGASVGLAAVILMLVIVGILDNRAIVPPTSLEWQESAEYLVSIALATLAGNLLARLLRNVKLTKSSRAR
jgi:TIR domain